MEILKQICITVPPLLFSVILHEVAHGLAAERLGDRTARDMGRITLNPLVHIDPFMTIILPGLLIWSGSPIVFGGAKPVPINPYYFSNPRRHMALVALAGPLTNFVLAAISAFLLWLALNSTQLLPQHSITVLVLGWLSVGIVINIVLGVFNMIPIPPLDGGRIAVGFLPRSLAARLARLEPYGIFIVILILYGLSTL